MPYEWVKDPAGAPERSGAPSHPGNHLVAELHLWPYRSLPRKGFVWFIAGTAALLLIPLLAVLGSPVLWGLLPFLLAAIGAIWWALTRSYRDGEIVEELRLWPDRITIDRHGPRGRHQEWEANPYWISLHLHEKGGPVPNYLTLRGGPREVELGAFLSEEERQELKAALDLALVRARSVPIP
jgi:uncharacterized membrane protein